MLGRKKQKPRRPTGHFDTLISSRATIQGDVHFSGGLHVDGKVCGTLMAEEGSEAVLRISEVGTVEGDIRAPHVIVNGTVHGDVYAFAHLELAENAAIHGNVYYNLIQMAMGASVNGNLVHQSEPAGLLTRSPQAGLGVDQARDSKDTGKVEEESDDTRE